MNLIKNLLKKCVLKKEEIDRFLNPGEPNWAVFDSTLGYKLKDSFLRDGMDGCYSSAHYSGAGERKIINYANKQSRINTYGNSFTQCHQVSDGETWQEILAAHFGEPIRNFGIGGYGVYQAYLRLLREESLTDAENIIFNIWMSDDHLRSLMSWRWIFIDEFRDSLKDAGFENFFHANPWSYVRLERDNNKLKLKEFENICPTPASLYNLSDFDFIYETFKDDVMVHLKVARDSGLAYDIKALTEEAEKFEISYDFSNRDKISQSASEILLKSSIKASILIIEKLLAFIKDKNKKLILLFTYSDTDIIGGLKCKNGPDGRFLDFLKEKEIPFIDSLEKHKEDFKDYCITAEEYVKKYYIGHYNPKGNHFLAFAIKDDIIRWLQPNPVTYSDKDMSITEIASKLA